MKFLTNLIVLSFISFSVFAQKIDQFDYKNKLNGIQDQWHKIELTDDIIGQTNQKLSDIRVFGITSENDTVVAPYILSFQPKKEIIKKVDFKRINDTHDANRYYYTFLLKDKEAINQIKLDFGLENFDWKVKLEASQDQKKWFTVVEDYRLLSIKNDQMEYKFTDVKFKDAHYPYFRLSIKTGEDPTLTSAKINRKIIEDGDIKSFPIANYNVIDHKKDKTSEVNIDFGKKVRINHLSFNFEEDFDFYRYATIKYLSDSVKTEKGWKYNYKTLKGYTFNSVEKNEVNFKSTTLQKLKIIIYNKQNQPIQFSSVKASGHHYYLTTRFTEEANYWVVYGGKNVYAPDYDIKHFKKNIPENISTLEMGQQEEIEKIDKVKEEALFENEIWLWAIMGVMVFVLGGFAVKMLKSES
ncbi:DUF3999 family protein [Flammeovirga sp. MY04]|uniref:DUF3999 family protein n=1 Tax=Flammeovirga sp. MY04 TaxID=1191459 RepID=UPI0008061796|nr:DUF3999 family protein [Flammeovirga sp. MY04]ANQ52358.1 DUF3999 family protein [Flammeovirga sp. MY04]